MTSTLADRLGIPPSTAAALSQCQAVTRKGHRCLNDATKTGFSFGEPVGLCSTHARVWQSGELITWGPVGWEVKGI